MLVLKKISKSFGKIKALEDVSLSFKKGEVVALLGANGAGKTTLMRIICGIVDADNGGVNIFGSDINSQRVKALENIGYMPENNPTYQDLSVLEFLFFMAKIKNVKTEEIDSVINTMSLKDVLNQKIQTLSKGYKSRTAIAATLLAKPKILILDEPTEGLDPNQKQALRKTLREYAKKNIVLISTHILEEAEEMNSRIVVLNKGKLIADTSVEEIKGDNKKNMADVLRKIME